MNEISMWDDTAAALTTESRQRMASLAEAAVEPLWPYLSQATSSREFEDRLAIAQESVVRVVAEVTGDYTEAPLMAVAYLRNRHKVALVQYATSQAVTAALSAVQASSDVTGALKVVQAASYAEQQGTLVFETGSGDYDPDLVIQNRAAEDLIGKRIRLICFNDNGVATEYMGPGRITGFKPTADGSGEIEWTEEGGSHSYPISTDDIAKVYRLQEATDPAQMSLFASLAKQGHKILYMPHSGVMHLGPDDAQTGAMGTATTLCGRVLNGAVALERAESVYAKCAGCTAAATSTTASLTASFDALAAEDRKGHSMTCPKCKAQMSSVIETGDTLHATCDACGWSGTKTRKSGAAGWLDKARKVVTDHQHTEIGGILLDATTASMLIQIHDALSPDRAAQFAAMDLTKAVSIGWKLVSKTSSTHTAVGENGQCQQVNAEGVQCSKPAGHSDDEHDFSGGKTAGWLTDKVFGVDPQKDPKYDHSWQTPGEDFDKKFDEAKKSAAKTASTYCPNHGVYVGDGNREQHDHCKTEQRKSADSRLRGPAVTALLQVEASGRTSTCQNCGGQIIQQNGWEDDPEIWVHSETEEASCENGFADEAEPSDFLASKQPSAVQALLESEAAFFHAPQKPNQPARTTTAPTPVIDVGRIREQRQQAVEPAVEESEPRDKVKTEAHRVLAEIDDAVLDGLGQADDFTEDRQPLTTRPRVMPLEHQPPQIPEVPQGAPEPEFAPVDPLTPTVGQKVQARIATLAKRVKSDNPHLSDQQARAVAAHTVATYPEMVSSR